MPTQRGTSWQGIVYHKSLAGGRARRNFDNETDATAWELESKARLLKGKEIELGDMGSKQAVQRRDGIPHTLVELVRHVERTRWAAKASGARQAVALGSMVSLIGPNKPVTILNKHDIDVARSKLLHMGNSPATVNRKVAALSTCLTEAMDMGIIAAKPKCSKYKESEHRIRRFTAEEEAQAVDYFDRMGERDMVDYVMLSLDTGLRQGEMVGLLNRDVEADKVMVWGTGAKSGKTRSVPLTARAKGILARRKGKPSEPVFPGMTQRTIRTHWDKLTELLGLEDDAQFVPHIMRHEFCSRLADRDMNASVIQQLAGHATLSVTQRYIHVRADSLIRAINALEARP